MCCNSRYNTKNFIYLGVVGTRTIPNLSSIVSFKSFGYFIFPFFAIIIIRVLMASKYYQPPTHFTHFCKLEIFLCKMPFYRLRGLSIIRSRRIGYVPMPESGFKIYFAGSFRRSLRVRFVSFLVKCRNYSLLFLALPIISSRRKGN